MKLRKLISGVLCLFMLGVTLTGCGNAEKDAASNSVPDSTAEDSGGYDQGDNDDRSEESGHAAWDDMEELNVVLIAPGSVPPGIQEVEDGINEITEPLLNTHINLEMVEMGNYIQTVSLKMTSGERVDLLMTFPGGAATFAALQSQGQLMAITDLLDTYGQPILETVGDYIKSTTVEGEIYGVPVYRDYSTSVYAVMRTDVLQDLGLEEKAADIQCLDDLEEILAAVQDSEQWGYLSGLSPAAGNGTIAFNSSAILGMDSAQSTLLDPLGSTEIVFADPTGEDQTVQLLASSKVYRDLSLYIRDWYDKGYIYKDSATSSDTGADLVRSNKGFGMIMNGELGIESSVYQMCEMPMTCVKLETLPITTSSCTGFAWAVPITSQAPEAAVTFLSMMYTSGEINDLLAWGVEGRDYVIENGMASFPDGNSDVPYHSSDYITGNQFLVTPWEGQPEDIRQQAKDSMAEALISAYLGFTFNSDPVANELSAVNNVIAEYSAQINCGVGEASALDDYIAKLESCNVQKIVDEYQKQLDEWINTK